MLITKAIEKYSMNGYSVIKVLTHSPHKHKREVGEGRFIVLHPLRLSKNYALIVDNRVAGEREGVKTRLALQ